MGGPKDYHTRWSQSEKQIPYDITCMWNLKYDTNEHTYEIETGEGNGKSTRVFLPGKFHE